MFSIRFSELLKIAMAEYHVGSTKLAEVLDTAGDPAVPITNKRISEYVRAVSTPSFEKAKLIMDALEYPIDDESLKESLRLNRELIKEEKQEQLLLDYTGYGRTLNVHIRLRNLIPGLSTLDVERRVMDRVDQLYGDRDLVKYVEKLIAADLRQSLLKGDLE